MAFHTRALSPTLPYRPLRSLMVNGDLAFDALAFIPSSKPVASYVALGDSYSSGESTKPYDGNSDVSGVNLCHRLNQMSDAMQQTITGAKADVGAADPSMDIRFVDAPTAQRPGPRPAGGTGRP